jgi:hypothetical protein
MSGIVYMDSNTNDVFPMSTPPTTLLDSLVVLKGSQLNLIHQESSKERLPASAGLPSAAGLHRSRSIGGTILDGVARRGSLLSNLSKTGRQKREVEKPVIKAKALTQTRQRSKSISLVRKVEDSVPPIDWNHWSSGPKRFNKPKKSRLPNDSNAIADVSISMQKIHISVKKSKPKLQQVVTKTEEFQKIQALIQDANEKRHLKEQEFLRKRAEILHLNDVARVAEEEKWQKKKESEMNHISVVGATYEV